MDHAEELNLRSEHSRTEAYVRFINITNRSIDIIWVDFSSRFIKYNTISRHQFLDINTFTNHPWIFWDTNTKENMFAQGKSVFYAIPSRCPSTQKVARKTITIHLPLYSLKMCALLVVRNHLKNNIDIDELDLPHVLKDDLKNVIDVQMKRTLLLS